MAAFQTLQVNLGERSYPIIIGNSVLSEVSQYIKKGDRKISQIYVVTDETVEPLYADALAETLAKTWKEVELVVIPPGEDSKCIDMATQLWERLFEGGGDRDTMVLAVGGGVVGDLAGFVASTFNRGIGFFQVPTTLLAQVDSSVGGKTAIDLNYGKNIIGTFYQPHGVLIDVATLKTLDNRQFLAGMGEVIKYGVILDEKFFGWLEAHIEAIVQRDTQALQEIVFRCCQLKAQIVHEDEKEISGRRALLNYGHTFGHALETFGRFEEYLHGEAVSIGMATAAGFAQYLGMIPADTVRRQNLLLAQLGLKTRWPSELSVDEAIKYMRHDKKSAGGKIQFVLPRSIGCCELVRDIPESSLVRFLELLK